MFTLPFRSFGACFLMLLCHLCLAQSPDCDPSQLSHVGESECLRKDYRGIDRLLRQKLDQLIAIVEPADMSTAPTDQVNAKRKQIQDAVRRADALWRESLKVECDALISASYGMGNGDDLASLRCRISRTQARIKHLSMSEEYQWLWRR
jgi:uncharacterized protein YecT (DUF1311 family)